MLLKSSPYSRDKLITYTYDELNRLKTVTNWLNETASYQYDGGGRLIQSMHFNGSMTTYGYDNADRLIKTVNQKSDGEIITSQEFELDDNGNRVKDIRTKPQQPYEFSKTLSYQYNTQKNRLQSINDGTSTIALDHDNEGQQQFKDWQVYDFNSRHQLIRADNHYFDYDGADNRLKVTRDGVVTYYIYDINNNLLAEADENKVITRYYIHGAGLMAMVEDNVSYSYHFDAVGSTLAITDTNETIVNQYAYSPYGRDIGRTIEFDQPFTYVGQYGVYEESRDFYHMRVRYYDAQTGRFISEDPLGLDAGVNLYAYANGNPLIYVDPDGDVAFNVAGAVFGAVSGGIGACVSSGGDLRSVLSGAGVGAVAGIISPAGAISNAVVGFASNVSGQLVGGANLNTLDYGLATSSAIGGAAGTRLTGYLANSRRSRSAYLLNRGLGKGNQNARKIHDAAIQGFVGGATEAAYSNLK